MLRRLSSGAAALALISMSVACATGVTVQGSGGAPPSGASVGSAGMDGGSDAEKLPPGSCTLDVDCLSMKDACNTGVCVNGTCVKGPANEFAPCEDGLFCTD